MRSNLLPNRFDKKYSIDSIQTHNKKDHMEKKKTYTILIQDTAEYEVEAVSEADALAIFERQAPNPAECLEEFGELSYEVVPDNEDDEPSSRFILPKKIT